MTQCPRDLFMSVPQLQRGACIRTGITNPCEINETKLINEPYTKQPIVTRRFPKHFRQVERSMLSVRSLVDREGMSEAEGQERQRIKISSLLNEEGKTGEARIPEKQLPLGGQQCGLVDAAECDYSMHERQEVVQGQWGLDLLATQAISASLSGEDMVTGARGFHGHQERTESVDSSRTSRTESLSSGTTSGRGRSRGNRGRAKQRKEVLPLEKTFVCGDCGLSFARKHDLTRHERIHSGVKAYVCGRCNKAFSRKDGLNRHEAMDEEAKRYRCKPLVFPD